MLRTARFRSYILNCLLCRGGCGVRSLVRVSFYRVPETRKRTRKFTDELKSNYACFRNGRDEWEAE
jgi:hypothetical protein